MIDIVIPVETVRPRLLDREIARIGFGGCPMGRHAWGPTSDRDLIDAVHTALDAGITLFDTSDVYGLGHSETLLGQALTSHRHQAIVATKFGVRRTNGNTHYDCSPKWIRTALEGSLARLQTDVVDLYQMHYWDGVTPLDEVFGTLKQLRAEGKIRSFGVTNFDLGTVTGPLPEALVTFSHDYSLTNRSHESTIARTAQQRDLTFLSWGSLGHGVLTGKYDTEGAFESGDRRNRETYRAFHGDGLEKSLRIVGKMADLLSEYPERTMPQLALRWLLDRHPAAIALVGIKTPAQISDNVAALGWHLAEQHVQELDEVSLPQ